MAERSNRNRNTVIAALIVIILLLLWLWPTGGIVVTTTSSTSTTTITSSSGNLVTIDGAAPYSNFGFNGVQFTFSVSPNAPYYTDNSGAKHTYVGITGQLFNSATGALLDTSYPTFYNAPGYTLTAQIPFQNYAGYPGLPTGSYRITITPYICTNQPIPPFTGCSQAGPAFTGQFTV